MRFIAVFAFIALLGTPPAYADDDPHYVPGPWHYHAVTCVDTTVTSAVPSLMSADFIGSGTIAYATGLGIAPLFPTGHAAVTHYSGTPGNAVMAAERVGDSVQVCYLGGPAPTTTCDPDKDNRGRSYRVWDYKQKQQYWGYNSEHLCGGA